MNQVLTRHNPVHRRRRPEAWGLGTPEQYIQVVVEVMDSLLAKAKINDWKYFDLLARVS